MRGFYSLIQFCPDESRCEAVNLGVVLFGPEAGILEARSTGDYRRAKRFFGPKVDAARLDSARQALLQRFTVERERFQSLEDFEQFAASRSNSLLLTPPRPIWFEDAVKELDTLFRELVEEEESTHTIGPRSEVAAR